MRICLVTREYPPLTSYTGGIGTHYQLLAPALARLGHEIHVLTLAEDGEGDRIIDGVTVHLLKRANLGPLWPFADLRWGLVVDRALRRSGPFDAIHVPEWGGDAWRYARSQRAGPLVTLLATSLAQILDISPNWQRPRKLKLQHFIQDRLERTQAQHSHALTASSAAVLEWARQLWSIDALPSTVLPNMIDVDRIRQLSQGEPAVRIPQDGPIVGFSGRLEPRKGVDTLVEAMNIVWEQLPQASLVLAGLDADFGDRMMSDHLRRLAGRHHERLIVAGYLSHEHLFATLAQADVMALPSRWENFGIVALEAMALGKPTVLTTAGGWGEYFRDGQDGLMVPPEDPFALAQALLRLLDDPDLRKRFGDAAGKRADDFSVPVVTKQYEAFFKEIAGT